MSSININMKELINRVGTFKYNSSKFPKYFDGKTQNKKSKIVFHSFGLLIGDTETKTRD